MDIEDELNDQNPSGSWMAEAVRAWGPAILAVIIIRSFLFEPFRIPSGSMVPTLLVGDFVVVTKYSYGLWLHLPFPRMHGVKSFELMDMGDPERGDVIVFRYPVDEGLTYIKRVVGLPGDRIRVRNNQIFVNDEAVKRTYQSSFQYQDDRCYGHEAKLYIEELDGTPHYKLTNRTGGGFLADIPEVTIAPDTVFVMGDNRDNSEDSRKCGFVRYDQIKGKARATWLSLDKCGESNSPFELRSERTFRSLYVPPEPVTTER